MVVRLSVEPLDATPCREPGSGNKLQRAAEEGLAAALAAVPCELLQQQQQRVVPPCAPTCSVSAGFLAMPSVTAATSAPAAASTARPCIS